jgi:general secretion pathway protein A
MYEEFYGFVQPPFTLAPDPRFLYRSESHDEAITGLLQAIRRKEGFIVLAGDIGTGKTTLCRALLEQLDQTTFTSLVLNPFLSVEELLREILLDFGVVSRDAVRSGRIMSASTHELISTLHEFLLSLIAIGGSGVLIIDEAQHLTPEVLEQIRVISNLETNQSKLLQIVLVGQLNLLDVLSHAQMRQLDQRISLRALLKPLTRDEVNAYISHRLSVAGGTSTPTFEPAAIDRIHAYSGGVPRVINLLCDRALMAGAEAQAMTITPEFVDVSAARLDLALPKSRDREWLKRLRKPALVTAAALLAIGAIAGIVSLIPSLSSVSLIPSLPSVFLIPSQSSVEITLPPLPPGIRPAVAQPIPVPPVPDVVIPVPRNLLLTPGLF